MKMIDNFTGEYSLTKTLKVGLKPVGKTKENFENRLETEEELNKNVILVKKLISDQISVDVEEDLSNVTLDEESLKKYEAEYIKSKEKEKNSLPKKANELRGKIKKQLPKDKLTDIKNSTYIKKYLPECYKNDKEATEALKVVHDFVTYFNGYLTNIKNMFTAEEKSTAIPYRCINDNLPKFIDNIKSYEIVVERIGDELSDLRDNFKGKNDTKVGDIFKLSYFNFVLPQSGIDIYNNVIGGYTTEKGVKVEGINEYINKYNQNAKLDEMLPFLTMLFNQISGKKKTISYIPEEFTSDDELLKAIEYFYNGNEENSEPSLDEIMSNFQKLFKSLPERQLDSIFIKDDNTINRLSNKMFHNWKLLGDLIDRAPEDEEEKQVSSISISELQNLIDNYYSENDNVEYKITEYFCDEIGKYKKKIEVNYNSVKELLSNGLPEGNSLKNHDDSIGLLKALLDSIKEFYYFVKFLEGTGEEKSRDFLFYEKYDENFNYLCNINRLYDKVRNYITSKPDSENKLKLCFDNYQFMGCWDRDKEKDYCSAILMRDNRYYLAIINKSYNDILLNVVDENCDDCYEKLLFKALTDPIKMLPKVYFTKKNASLFKPSQEVKNIYEKKKKKVTLTLDELHKLIDYYINSIKLYEKWDVFDFKFKDASLYNDYIEFCNDLKKQAYSIDFEKIPTDYVEECVNEGKLYLFEIHSRDLENARKGKKSKISLETMYFKMLFDDENLSNVVYKLNGGAEMFYRPASINKNDRAIHKKGKPIPKRKYDKIIKAKGEENLTDDEKKEYYKTFNYDIIKDRRYTEPKFFLHLPITVNFKQPKPKEHNINDKVNAILRESKNINIIGIDRGERNLLYITVINSKGEILEQRSLNMISSSNNFKTDYHEKLQDRKKQRYDARKNWTTIKPIKNLKEGYLGQAVHEICKLIIKYDAIVVMESLGNRFKKNRAVIEAEIYQKFENMLINKLNFLVDKDINEEEGVNACGGLLNAYQLTNILDSNSTKQKKQNGIVFFVNPSYTSKIDPTTGFVDLLHLNVKSKSVLNNPREYVEKIKEIRYNQDEDYFEFDIDFKDFTKDVKKSKSKWTVCSYGTRVDYDSKEEVNLTCELKKLLGGSNIKFINDEDIKTQLCEKDKEFLLGFLKLFQLVLQLRNSIGDKDYIISPVKNNDGKFYDSNNYKGEEDLLPQDGDANGAYNIARKGLILLNKIKENEENFTISNKDWFAYTQNTECSND